MASNVILQALERHDSRECRYVIWLFDPDAGPNIKGPDGGESHSGYSEIEIKRVVADKYGLSEESIDVLLHQAKSKATAVKDKL